MESTNVAAQEENGEEDKMIPSVTTSAHHDLTTIPCDSKKDDDECRSDSYLNGNEDEREEGGEEDHSLFDVHEFEGLSSDLSTAILLMHI
jgi:hypothetical protein